MRPNMIDDCVRIEYVYVFVCLYTRTFINTYVCEFFHMLTAHFVDAVTVSENEWINRADVLILSCAAQISTGASCRGGDGYWLLLLHDLGN